MSERLLEDTFLILGRIAWVHPNTAEHNIMTFTKEDAMKIGGYKALRADWAMVIGESESEWVDNVLRPFMFGCSREGQKPVIWYVPGLMEITDYSI